MGANELLRQARQARGWTQSYLAQQLGVDVQTVGSWERGRRFPSLKFRRLLCDLFALSPEQLGLAVSHPTKDESVLQKSSQRAVPQGKERSPVVPVRTTLHSDTHVVMRSNTLLKNRHQMLQRVGSRWIAGVLEHSLSHSTLIPLGLQDLPAAVENPWQEEVQESVLPPRYLPAGTTIVQVYDEAGGALLVLGEPGAGKTTLLLDLARTLLERARLDETHPLPIVFTLSSWAEQRLSLSDWLVKELQGKYQVPRSLALSWVRGEYILPLLDGLDEVAETQRGACVQAINSYRQEHGMLPLVICCRSVDYFVHPLHILLQRAVVVQPLTAQQIDDYVAHVGEELTVVRMALHHDHTLREMASTPLMLHILSLTYEGMSVDERVALDGPDVPHRLVLEKYVERLLHRRRSKHYLSQHTLHWLAWLARHMAEHNQTEFYLERMQPDWLPDDQTRQRYRNTVIKLIFGLEMFLGAALFACFRGDSVPTQPGLFYWLGGGVGNSVLGWMSPGLGSFRGSGSLGIIFNIVLILVILLVGGGKLPFTSLSGTTKALKAGLRDGILFGALITGFSSLVLSVGGTLLHGIYQGVGLGLFGGLITGMTSGLAVMFQLNQQSRSQSGRFLLTSPRILNAFSCGVCASVGFGCIFALQAGGIDRSAIANGVIIGFFSGAVYLGTGLEFKFFRGLGSEIQPAEIVKWSWSMVWQSLSGNMGKGGMLGLAITIGVAAVLTGASSLFYGVPYGVRYGCIYGVIIGCVTATASICTGILTDGWSSNRLHEQLLSRPNEGIRRSMKHALFAACLFGTIGGLLSGIVSGIAFWCAGISGWAVLGTGLALMIGVVFAFQFWAFHGGIASVEHYTLRYFLWHLGAMPCNYVAFLDDAVERILLRKVGGGYIFAHRMLLDYFASLEEEKHVEGKNNT